MIDNPPIPFHAIITGTALSHGLSPNEAKQALRETLESSLDEMVGNGGITGSHDVEVESFSSSVNAGSLAFLELVRHVQDLAQRAGYVVALVTPEQLADAGATQKQLANLLEDAMAGLKDRKEGKVELVTTSQTLFTGQIHSIPVISTAHITQDVAATLSAKRNDNLWLPCADWTHGFFLHLDELEAAEGDGEETPQCLIELRNWLRSLEDAGVVDNSRWLRLDQDAEQVPGLTVYEW